MEGKVWSLMMMTLVATAVFMIGGECWEENGGGGGVIRVAGKVFCQDCTEGWNEWVNSHKPIKGCTVSITCMDNRKRIVYYGRDETDETGEFELTINKYIYGKEIKPEACFTRLVSSPDLICNIPTNFSGGKTGVKLGRPAVVYRDVTKHVLGPFYYTTPMCDEPDNDGDLDKNKY